MTLPLSNASRPDGRGMCIIMAGGRGTRFWPLSRTDRPKQLLALASGKSLLRETFERLEPLVGADRILVVTSGALAAPTRAELPELPAEHVVNEPVGRNTAPCAVLGMGLAARIDPSAPVALLPADHYIPDDDVFRAQLAAAFARAVDRETVLTIGIPPTRPETGYGYLHVEAEAPEGVADADLRRGLEFVEKPDAQRAEQYVRSGNHLWNSGIFVWNPDYFATVGDREIPAVRSALAPAIRQYGTETFAAALEGAYAECDSVSLDVAVMEKLDGFDVLRARFRWSDLGSWDAWGELADELPGGNRGRADLLAVDSGGNVLMAPDKFVALVGVDDLIVVESGDALLICRKDRAQEIKKVIAALETGGRSDLL